MVTVKCVLIGNAEVGKTTFVKRWAGKPFDAHTSNTIGADYRFLSSKAEDGSQIGIDLWDTAILAVCQTFW